MREIITEPALVTAEYLVPEYVFILRTILTYN
jgi:hypothetical protein